MIHTSVKELVHDALENIEQARQKGRSATLPTGLINIDKVIGGFKAGEFIIIGSRPGMGKSSFVYSLVLNQATDLKMPVALFTLENAATEVIYRMLAILSGIPYQALTRGRLANIEKKIIEKGAERLMNANLVIEDSPALEIEEFTERCAQLKNEQGIRMIYVDSLQNFRTKKNYTSKVDEYTHISNLLKKAAVKLKIAIAATGQLNRSVETRGGWKMPMLSDLRESGALEQDADKVIFIYRPEYYHIDMFEDGSSTEDMAILNIAKNRYGPQADIKVRFNSKTGLFSDKIDLQIFSSIDFNDIKDDIPF